jgi:error-prone DNA polymerase
VKGLANLHAARILAARGDVPFASIEDVWRRSGVPLAALEKLADADAFAGLGVDRRQALWQVRGLGGAPLPLFAAADAREAGFRPEGAEPAVALTPMTEGREVVEDYRSVQLSLRAHPLAFLRPELARRGIVRCADLARIKDGRKAEVAGIILIRQKPGSAKGVLFVTIEDETGVANAIIWPARFEAQRRVILSSAMVSIKGQVQKEGGVIHVIADRISDYTPMLHSVGAMEFPHRPGPGDGHTHGGAPDPREHWQKRVKDQYHAPFRTGADPEDVIQPKSRNFH